MKNLKPVLWLAVGMFAGAVGVVAANQSNAVAQDPAAVVGQRLQVTKAGMALYNDAYFLKDSKSGACWLALRWDSSNQTVAPAPREACD